MAARGRSAAEKMYLILFLKLTLKTTFTRTTLSPITMYLSYIMHHYIYKIVFGYWGCQKMQDIAINVIFSNNVFLVEV